ncbi:MAG: hypothetical protein AVDCRST_MAG40-2592 [uncultured Gemmatimonadaceae bacterium]|uniref:Uncharacterized protein n=1 Tax=uncultured Gemmatimonadaceae bacterium TaxID=246130 RepID=A0A6J4LY22_9BACT|nr:MAG: hypothetical protein AVDCRST_MAG40-2592 [uncultured Gemmatimonadaceae bacterium]
MQSKINFARFGVPAALLMLAVWAVASFAYEAPGWVHMLLTGGVFLLIYSIVVRGTPPAADDEPRR